MTRNPDRIPLGATSRRIVDLVAASPTPMTVGDIARATGLLWRDVHNALYRLRARGVAAPVARAQQQGRTRVAWVVVPAVAARIVARPEPKPVTAVPAVPAVPPVRPETPQAPEPRRVVVVDGVTCEVFFDGRQSLLGARPSHSALLNP